MNIFTDTSRVVITCNKRLAPYLEKEVEALGFEQTRVFGTGVELKGTVNDCINLNLNLRCASQIHYSLLEFEAHDPDELYRGLNDYAWENILMSDGYFSVTCNVDNETINNTMFVNVKVKDAIVDRLRMLTKQRPDSGPDLDRAVIHLYWKDNNAEIFVDTSGHTLAKHGYDRRRDRQAGFTSFRWLRAVGISSAIQRSCAELQPRPSHRQACSSGQFAAQ